MPPRSDHSGFPADRRILPACEVKPQRTSNGLHRVSVLVEPYKQLPKRKQVTAVACRPCKSRKSKCNGARPTCAACIKRGQPDDCEYDINSDQRRTAALKDRIQELRKETDNLKAIIIALTRDRGDSNVYQVVEDLVVSGFLDVATAAELLKSDSQSPEAKDPQHAIPMDSGIVYASSGMAVPDSPTSSWLAVMQSQQLASAVYQSAVPTYAVADSVTSPTTSGTTASVEQYWSYHRLPQM